MPGDDFGLIGEGEKATLDGVNDLFAVPSRQISSADAAGEECVACEHHLERCEVETDRALGMTGGVDDGAG